MVIVKIFRCDHSRKLAPIYEQLAQQLQDEGSPSIEEST